MRWFFLIVIALAGALVNIAVITDDPSSKVPAIAAFNVALAGLALIWYGSYFEQNVVNANSRDLGISLLCFSIGIFIVLEGINAVLSDSCDGFFSSRSYRLRNNIVWFVQSLGYCKELGYVVAFSGGCLTYIGARLVFRITRRSY